MRTNDVAGPIGTDVRLRGRVRGDLWYFVLALLAVSWVPMGLATVTGQDSVWFIVGTSGPTIAALLLWLVGRRLGRARPVVRRSVAARIARPVAAGVTALVLGVAPPLLAVMTASGVDARPIDLGQPLRLILGAGGPPFALVSFLLAGPIAEELGWRGFVQPRLRRFFAPVATSVVLGLGWAVWHLPLFLVDGTTQSKYGLLTLQGGLYLAGFVPLSYLAWFVSERLGGGVVAAILLHFAGNATQALLRNDPAITTAASTVVATVLAILVHVAFRPAARPLPLTAPGRRRWASRKASATGEGQAPDPVPAGAPAVERTLPRG